MGGHSLPRLAAYDFLGFLIRLLLFLHCYEAAKAHALPLPSCIPGASNAIGVVNSAKWHSEVLLGVLHALSPFAPCTTAYVHPVHLPSHHDASLGPHLNGGGVWALHGAASLLQAQPVRLRPLPVFQNGSRVIVPSSLPLKALARAAAALGGTGLDDFLAGVVPRHDVLWFLSPETDISYTVAFIRAVKPRVVVALLHEPRWRSPLRLERVHADVRFAVLSPHVAAFVRARYGIHASVLTPSMPYVPPDPAASCFLPHEPGLHAVGWDERLRLLQGGVAEVPPGVQVRHGCLRGVTVQGTLSTARRSYTSLFREVALCARQLPADSSLHVSLAGALDPAARPEFVPTVPAGLKGLFSLHPNLPYHAFNLLLYTSYALLPSLGSESYLTDKATSSLLVSLSTGVPLMVDADFLRAYTGLDAGTALLLAPGETLCAAYERIAAMPAAEYAGVRARLRARAAELNWRAALWVAGLLEDVASRG